MAINRRLFLMGAAGAARRVYAAERISLGVIGSGGRGTFVMGVFQKDPAVQVGAICDVYEPNLERALSAAAKAQGGVSPKSYRNHHQLLDDKSIDAVLVATPEHWHHRMVLDALAAGKDVYVEKPLCHTPEQGVELVAAEKRSKNIVQVGMQRRSYDLYQEGRRVVAAGTLGDVRMVRSWWLNTQLGGQKVTELKGPLDWAQWLGPVEKRPMDPDVFSRWRLYSDFAGGIVADQGAHVFDGIHMLMGSGAPLAVTAASGRPHAASGNTPESVVVTAEYPEDFIGVFTINYAAMRYKSRYDQMNHLDGDKARMDIGREELRVFALGGEETPVVEKRSEKGFGWATDLHVMNFLGCVLTRKPPAAPMWLGFQAALVVQLANLSLKNGRRMKWNRTTNQVEV
ncbi:Gfo/Idh/MocA family oxidoreductase [uncultured Paludibaculum sp.]|uniref:Gfo/Idh/MocA family protein n=1 Tax=uncultured Paludibaculum sp. TaxID=1765020 RepID=UPI002AABAFE2|nr:Gfo/Idh/MocA family oxidoreductase [uncultured Paludibaculum sp.]